MSTAAAIVLLYTVHEISFTPSDQLQYTIQYVSVLLIVG